MEIDCTSCGSDAPANECPASKRACGHHCNHSWTHDACCWCGKMFDAGDYDEAENAAARDGLPDVGDN